jgi:hypothetical protein
MSKAPRAIPTFCIQSISSLGALPLITPKHPTSIKKQPQQPLPATGVTPFSLGPIGHGDLLRYHTQMLFGEADQFDHLCLCQSFFALDDNVHMWVTCNDDCIVESFLADHLFQDGLFFCKSK